MFQLYRVIHPCVLLAFLMVLGCLVFPNVQATNWQQRFIGAGKGTNLLTARYPLRQRTPNFYSRSKISQTRGR